MSTITLLIVVLLILAFVGTVPTWPYSRGWGYYPGGATGIILVIVLILLLTGHLR